MKTHPQKTLSLVLAVAFSLSFLPTESQAQGFSFYGQNPFSFLGFGQTQGNDALGKNVYQIDSLADQMAWRFGWEIRNRRDSQDSIALLNLMKSQTGLTNDLIKAYKGDSGSTFTKVARDVHDNLTRIQTLRKQVQMSDSVNALIAKSIPLTNYVHRNAHLFRPVPIGKSQSSVHGTPPAVHPPRGNGGHNPNHNAGFSNTGSGSNIYRG